MKISLGARKSGDKYYGGKASMVKNRENELSGNVDLSIDMFQSVCVENHVEMINREWLYDYLKDSNDYEKLRRKIERKMKNFYEPISLREMV